MMDPKQSTRAHQNSFYGWLTFLVASFFIIGQWLSQSVLRLRNALLNAFFHLFGVSCVQNLHKIKRPERQQSIKVVL